MAVYDPKAETWTMVAPPSGWDFIGDSPWTMLANGHLMLGNKLNKRVAELDPKTLTWTEVSSFNKEDVFAEEGLTLLPDGSVLTVNMTDRWQGATVHPQFRSVEDAVGRHPADAGHTAGNRHKRGKEHPVRRRQESLSSARRDRPGDPPAGRHGVQHRRELQR